MKNNTTKYHIGGRCVAVLRHEGRLCDIRRRHNGFLYNPPRVAVAVELLDSLDETATLQFTNLDSGDVWTTSVADFRRFAKPIQYAGYEPQAAVELSRMNYTIQGKRGKTRRRNELLRVEDAPVPEYKQGRLWG